MYEKAWKFPKKSLLTRGYYHKISLMSRCFLLVFSWALTHALMKSNIIKE